MKARERLQESVVLFLFFSSLAARVHAGCQGSSCADKGSEYEPSSSIEHLFLPGQHFLGTAESLVVARAQYLRWSAPDLAGVRAVLSESGLQYAKDVLVGQVLAELIPLNIPDMQLLMPMPLGLLEVNLTNIVLWNASVPQSVLLLDEVDSAITVFGGNAAANLSLSWEYAYEGFLGDHGNASVAVGGLEVVAVGNVSELDGGLAVYLIEDIGCSIQSIDISFRSTYAWIYNWLKNRLPNHIRAAVQAELVTNIEAIVDELNAFLQGLPREIPVDCVAGLDVTVPGSPQVRRNSLLLESRGEFFPTNCSSRHGRLHHNAPALFPGAEILDLEAGSTAYEEGEECQRSADRQQERSLDRQRRALRGGGVVGGNARDRFRPSSPRTLLSGGSEIHNVEVASRGAKDGGQQGLAPDPSSLRMISLSVAHKVIDSAVLVYYDAGWFSLAFRDLPDGFPLRLNTRAWRFVLPLLYHEYPDRDMQVAFEVLQPPSVTVADGSGVRVSLNSSILIQVLVPDDRTGVDEAVGVMYISLVLDCSASVGLRVNNVTGALHLTGLAVRVVWSKVGGQSKSAGRVLNALTRVLVEFALLPLTNRRLSTGFPLPAIPGVALEDPLVVYHEGSIEICADLRYTGGIFGTEQRHLRDGLRSWRPREEPLAMPVGAPRHVAPK